MATPRVVDRVRETITTSGTGSYAVGSSAVTGYRSIPNSLANGESAVFAVDDSLGGYEVFLGTYTAPSTLARTTIIKSSNSNLAVSWAPGAKTIASVLSADYADMNRMKHNLAATAAPAVTDDTADGYHPGSLWFDLTGRRVYFCAADTLGAAVWTEMHSSVRLAVEQATTTPAVVSGGALLAVGASTVASATAAIAVGGGADATAVDTIALGSNSGASAESAIALGTIATTSGVRAIALGYGAVAVGYGSVALGENTYSTLAGAVVRSTDNATDVFVNGGWLMLGIKTANATPTYLQFKLDQATYGETALSFEEQSFAYSGIIVARSAANTKAWKVEGAVKRDAGGDIELVGTPTMVAIIAEDSGATTWTLTVSVNTGTQALRFDVTGQAATNIAWGGKIMFTQLEYYE